MYFSVLLAGAAALLMLLPAVNSVSVPPPKPHDKDWVVAHQRASLVDSSRKDPLDPTQDRKLAVSLFIPVGTKACSAQHDNLYMPDQTAKVSNQQFFGDQNANFFEKLHFDSCSSVSGSIDAQKLPLLVFEPAVGTSRLVYNQLARQLSAVGTAVVTIDHPHDASIIEFEDAAGQDPIVNNGTTPLDPFDLNKPWNDTTSKAVEARRADINFVLDQLGTTDQLKRFFPDFQFSSGLNTKSFGILGHGLGGAVATQVAAEDTRCNWSINLSGTAPLLTKDIQDYIIFFGLESYKRSDDDHWRQALPHLVGRTVEWDMMKGGVMDYTDLPLLVSIVPSNQKVKGLGDNGVWAFHCTSCFLEAYVRDTIMNERGEISACLRMCPFLQPVH